MDYNKILKNTITAINYENPNIIKLKSDGNDKKFDLDWNTSQKISKLINRQYYFGTDIKLDTEKEFLQTFKELLKIKRALKIMKSEN
ncbi:hypothetical protein FJQ98_16385 [Lysinibacillus agricola]|uniref:Recombinase domain-containing protein n=1 Tax=Lysinibacillus agricola TaxID=2590012 RepID=A0ABX7ALN9_9BACI|nr:MULTISPECIES: hypothetical protein [Lysinibacillus]KOS61489.1 hypothetical protein AN161_18025 [Lysinibacillus sp. FJAT-14222]QQP10823.1 hypothetical protein FJQ98_16385 [Lysinibacillus agricola]